MSIFTDNKGFTPVPGFNFLLRVEMVFDVPVKSVRAFTKNFEYEYIQEGGLNDYVHMRRKPISQPFTLEIERYAATDLYYDPLQNGTELMLPLLLFVSPYQGDFMGYSRRTFAFTGCTVTGKEYGALDAEKGGLLTETIKIAYRQIVVLDLPETILKQHTAYSDLFGDASITEEDMKTPQYGRQKDDSEYKAIIAANIQKAAEDKNEMFRSYINSDGHLGGTESADKTFTYLPGERGTKDDEDAKARKYRTGYGKFDGVKSADTRTYLDGEMGSNPDANKRAYPEDESYYGKEILDTYKQSAKDDSRSYPEDESYYGKEILDIYEQSAKDNSRSYPEDESYYGKDIIDAYKKSAKDNSRAYPPDESYYGKDVLEAYKNAAKTTSRKYPPDESYYGKDVLQAYKSAAKNNARKWPPTQSAFGIGQKKGK